MSMVVEELKRQRKTGKEQYYTLPVVADTCVKHLESAIGSLNGYNFLEPCAGTGEFIEAIHRHGIHWNSIHAFDIEPKHRHVKLTTDFLCDTIRITRPIVVLTNPPFGRAHSLSVKFFNHCAPSTDVIAFVTTKAWRKWSIQNRLDQNFHLILDVDLPSVCFYLPDGTVQKQGKLQPIFQVWQRKNILRPIYGAEDRGYIKKVGPKEADVALTIFGSGCGTVMIDFDRIPNTTKMFLKLSNKRKVLMALRTVDFSRFFNNVSYTEALSIKEIWCLLNEYFDDRSKQA